MKNTRTGFTSYSLFPLLLIIPVLLLSCQPTDVSTPNQTTQKITEAEVIASQKAWGVGVIGIGVAHANGGDYVEAAKKHIEKFYGYDMGKVLFKPTLAAEKQFRNTFDGALSYFVGGNETYPEDTGFALKQWKNVRWENAGILNSGSNMAVAMGNYYFSDQEGEETKVEYTFCYRKDENGDIKIVAHKSAIPYNVE